LNSIATSTEHGDNIAKWQQSDGDYNLSQSGFIASIRSKCHLISTRFSWRTATLRFAKQASRIGVPLAAGIPTTTTTITTVEIRRFSPVFA